MTGPDIIVSQVVEVPLETLWESWSDFGGIFKFHHDVVRTTILTEKVPRGVGAVRRCDLADGRNKIEERVIDWKPTEAMSIEFSQTTLPVASARADFLFKSCGDARSRVEMHFRFTPRGLIPRLMKIIMVRKMRAGFTQLLQNNKQYLERQHTPSVTPRDPALS